MGDRRENAGRLVGEGHWFSRRSSGFRKSERFDGQPGGLPSTKVLDVKPPLQVRCSTNTTITAAHDAIRIGARDDDRLFMAVTGVVTRAVSVAGCAVHV